jgi:hypothetical protein
MPDRRHLFELLRLSTLCHLGVVIITVHPLSEELLQEGICQLLILSGDCRVPFGLEEKLEYVREKKGGDKLVYRYLKDDSNINDKIAPRNR